LRAARSIGAVGLWCLLLCACADSARVGPESYVVRPQDTLYSIAWRHDVDYRDLARWNHIGSDYRITVGQVLVLGPRETTSHPATRTPAPAPAAGAAPQVGKPKPLAEPKAVQALPGSPAGRAAAPAAGATPGVVATPEAGLKWVWPTEVHGAPRPVPGGGILLSGRLGQDVRAASAGRVVYSGNGLRGYGNLIIIKHADTVLSAYAHNREMLVHDGDEVTMGQVIGHMGEGPNQAPILYFEIRRNGKPVDPLPSLPKIK
jgi:lipoprotein NlpD